MTITVRQGLCLGVSGGTIINPKHGEGHGPLDPYVHHNPFIFATQQYDCLMEAIFHSIT